MRLHLVLISMLLCTQMSAQQLVIEPTHSSRSTFAIMVDNNTYEACKEDITAYKQAIEREKLGTYVLVADWQTPEMVKDVIKDYYYNHSLEGVVFIGNIPTAMIRGAQHFTSAFKMDEKSPMFDSSVPSDRFYDDFDLTFDFISRDSVHTNCFYYWLNGNAPGMITCDIYSGRIKPILKGEEGYAQIREYLKKVVREKNAENYLDKVLSFTGHGSFSNSLVAWKDETITLKEQMPAVFSNADGIKFYLYNMYPFMKETVTNELRRDDLDLAFFHEHGTPDRQWMTGEPPATELDEYFADAKRDIRHIIKTGKRYGKTDSEIFASLRAYGIDSRWWKDANDKETIIADSIYDAKTGILLEDVYQIKPNSRITIFDACYNGDFREDDFIADRYIFSEGKAVVSLGNSVNVLQDKSSSDLLGMLSCGYSVGQWSQYTNILESHIIGDPTFKFDAKNSFRLPNLHSKSVGYWKKYLNEKYPVDIQSLALYKLFELEYDGLSDLLLETFKTSPYYMERLQCMHLLSHYNDGNYTELLKLSADDPYEFIRRKGVFYMGKVGDESFIPYIADMYMEDYMSARVMFNIGFATGHFRQGLLAAAVDEKIQQSEFPFDKEAFRNDAKKFFDRFESTMISTLETITDPNQSTRRKMFYMTGLKNDPYPHALETIINIVKDPATDPQLRLSLANVLGWYVRSNGREAIVPACKSILDNEADLSDQLKDELHKTINRINAYLR